MKRWLLIAVVVVLLAGGTCYGALRLAQIAVARFIEQYAP